MKKKSFYFCYLFSNVKQVRQMLFITTGSKSHDSWWIALSPSFPWGNSFFARLELIFQPKEKNKTKPTPKSCSLAQRMNRVWAMIDNFILKYKYHCCTVNFFWWILCNFIDNARSAIFQRKYRNNFWCQHFLAMVWIRWLWLQNTMVQFGI